MKRIKRDRQARQEEHSCPHLRWLLSLGHYRPLPKGKLKRPPPLLTSRVMVQKRKKMIQLKKGNYHKKGEIWAHGNEGFHLPNRENTDEHKNEKPKRTFQNALKNSHQYESITPPSAWTVEYADCTSAYGEEPLPKWGRLLDVVSDL